MNALRSPSLGTVQPCRCPFGSRCDASTETTERDRGRVFLNRGFDSPCAHKPSLSVLFDFAVFLRATYEDSPFAVHEDRITRLKRRICNSFNHGKMIT
jgi:hypothetical protein